MPVLFPTFEVKITSRKAGTRYVQEVSRIRVELMADRPSDTAQVIVPSRDESCLDLFKEGDAVEISLGYEGDNAPAPTKVFSGELCSLSRRLPLVLTASDAFVSAKRTRFTQTYGTDSEPMHYSEIARDVLAKAGLSAFVPEEHDPGPGCRQHSVEFHDRTVAEAMEMLSERTQWVHFCIPGTRQVYFGPAWPYEKGLLPAGSAKPPDIYVYAVGDGRSYDEAAQGNVISSTGLEYRRCKPYSRVTCELYDARRRFLAVSKTAEAEGDVGPKTAALRLPYSYPDSDEASAKADAEEYALRCARDRLDELNSTELGGFFTTYGNPNLSHSHPIRLVWLGETKLAVHDGYYNAKRVIFTYSPQQGFHMKVYVSKPPLKPQGAKG